MVALDSLLARYSSSIAFLLIYDCNVTSLFHQSNGLIDLHQLEKAFRPDTSLVSIMFVNNEIGVKQPITEIGTMCRERKIFLHTDAAQVSWAVGILAMICPVPQESCQVSDVLHDYCKHIISFLRRSGAI